MGTAVAIACLLTIGWPSGVVQAQDRQSVQLPTISVFTVDTTVSVPDRGGMSVGGVGRRGAGQSSRGGLLPGRRAAGVAAGGGGVWIGATIMDFQTLDRAILAAGGPSADANVEADPLTRKLVAEADAGGGARSVAQIRRQRAANQSVEDERGLADLDRATAAMEAGKPGVARVYCRMALRRLSGNERQAADELWRALQQADQARAARDRAD
jgi:hypothetical protein